MEIMEVREDIQGDVRGEWWMLVGMFGEMFRGMLTGMSRGMAVGMLRIIPWTFSITMRFG